MSAKRWQDLYEEALKLAHTCTEELLRNLGPRVPADVRREITGGADAILEEVLNQHPSADSDEFLTTAGAAKLLFVSRPHLVKLIDQGKFKLHHKAGNNRFVTKASVLACQVAQQATIAAYNASTADEE